MKVNFEKTIGPIALIAISTFMLIMEIVHFITRRNDYAEYFEQVYRWEMSTIIPILLFFIIGTAFLLEVRGKEKTAHLVSTVASSAVLVAGTVIFFILDDYGSSGAFIDALLMIILPVFLVVVSFFRFKNQGKEVLTDKMRNILIYIIMGLIGITAIVAIVVIIQALRG